ncbi:GL14490, partial [Drosophila persimilis]
RIIILTSYPGFWASVFAFFRAGCLLLPSGTVGAMSSAPVPVRVPTVRVRVTDPVRGPFPNEQHGNHIRWSDTGAGGGSRGKGQ